MVKTSLPKWNPTYPDGVVGLFLKSTDIIRDIATNHRREKIVNLRRVFDQADTGGSGRVGQKELFNLFSKKGMMLTKKEFQGVYKFFDRDGGGIDYGEECDCGTGEDNCCNCETCKLKPVYIELENLSK